MLWNRHGLLLHACQMGKIVNIFLHKLEPNSNGKHFWSQIRSIWNPPFLFQPHVTRMQQQCAEIKYVSVVVSVCTPPLLICLSHPLACQHASTSHTLALGRSGSTRDVPAKSSSTSSLDPNTCNTKPWQPPSTHYQSYSIYRRYTSLTTGTTASHTLVCPLDSISLLDCSPRTG